MRDINSFEKDELLRFFLYHMSVEQRGLLMATYPLHYKMLYPSVSNDTVTNKVALQSDWMEKNSANLLPRRQPIL